MLKVFKKHGLLDVFVVGEKSVQFKLLRLGIHVCENDF